MTYDKCKELIRINRYEYEDMLEKLDVFLLADRIVTEEYEELKGMMDAKKI